MDSGGDTGTPTFLPPGKGLPAAASTRDLEGAEAATLSAWSPGSWLVGGDLGRGHGQWDCGPRLLLLSSRYLRNRSFWWLEHGLPHVSFHAFRASFQISFSVPCWLDLEALCLGLTGAPGPGHCTISLGHSGRATTADEQEHAARIPQEGKLRVGVSGDQETQGHREQQSRVRTLRLCGNVRDSNYPLSLLSTMW